MFAVSVSGCAHPASPWLTARDADSPSLVVRPTSPSPQAARVSSILIFLGVSVTLDTISHWIHNEIKNGDMNVNNQDIKDLMMTPVVSPQNPSPHLLLMKASAQSQMRDVVRRT